LEHCSLGFEGFRGSLFCAKGEGMKRLIIQMSLKAREVFNFDEGAARAVAEKLGDGKGTVFDTPGIPSFYASCSEAKNYTLLVYHAAARRKSGASV
jgi:hypothetical protein